MVGRKLRAKMGWNVGKNVVVKDCKIESPKVSLGTGSRLHGVQILANQVHIGTGVILEDCKLFAKKGAIIIGDGVTIKERSVINAFKGISIGDRTIIDRDVVVGGMQSEKSEFIVGRDCVVLYRSYLNTTRRIVIGNGTGIGGYTKIFTHSAWQNYLEGNPVKFADVHIGNDVWIAWDIIIMPGITIADNATIGTAAVVTQDIPESSIAVGVPARVVKIKTKDESIANKNKAMTTILDDFCSYAKDFLNLEIKSKAANRMYTIQLPGGRNLVYTPSVPKVSSKPGFVLISFSLPSSVKDSRGEWIELDTLRAKAPSAMEFIQFVRRYGIRILES